MVNIRLSKETKASTWHLLLVAKLTNPRGVVAT